MPAGVELKITVSPDSRNTAWVSFDGRKRQELCHGDSLRVTTSIYPIPSICSQVRSQMIMRSAASLTLSHRIRLRTGLTLWRSVSTGTRGRNKSPDTRQYLTELSILKNHFDFDIFINSHVLLLSIIVSFLGRDFASILMEDRQIVLGFICKITKIHNIYYS